MKKIAKYIVMAAIKRADRLADKLPRGVETEEQFLALPWRVRASAVWNFIQFAPCALVIGFASFFAPDLFDNS